MAGFISEFMRLPRRLEYFERLLAKTVAGVALQFA